MFSALGAPVSSQLLPWTWHARTPLKIKASIHELPTKMPLMTGGIGDHLYFWRVDFGGVETLFGNILHRYRHCTIETTHGYETKFQ